MLNVKMYVFIIIIIQTLLNFGPKDGVTLRTSWQDCKARQTAVPRGNRDRNQLFWNCVGHLKTLLCSVPLLEVGGAKWPF